jgi:hypothetical protein
MMAGPATLVIGSSQVRNAWGYLKWSYSFGTLLGLLDDIADLQEDLYNGLINTVAIRIRADSNGTILNSSEVINYISSFATRVSAQWHILTPHPERVPLFAASALSTSMTSWLGIY